MHRAAVVPSIKQSVGGAHWTAYGWYEFWGCLTSKFQADLIVKTYWFWIQFQVDEALDFVMGKIDQDMVDRKEMY